MQEAQTQLQLVTSSNQSEKTELPPFPSVAPSESKAEAPKQSTSCITAKDQIFSIPIAKIVPNPNQPRKEFSEASILKLADSIRQFGIIQPLTVRNLGHLFELVSGERRLRAAKELGWDTVPCILAEISDQESAQVSIIENLIREDLNIFEQALAIEALIDTYNLTQEKIAEKLSLSQSYIANKLRLLRFSSEERNLILSAGLTERHARALLRINDPILRKSITNQIISEELNVSASEQLIASKINSKCINSAAEATDSNPKANKEKHLYKDIPALYSAVNRVIDCAKSSNLEIKSRKIVGESFTEITIILPNLPQQE